MLLASKHDSPSFLPSIDIAEALLRLGTPMCVCSSRFSHYYYSLFSPLPSHPPPYRLYSQGFDDGWNANLGDVTLSVRQPAPNELRLQLWSVAAAGGKGLMVFQDQVEGIVDAGYSDSWDTMGTVLGDMRAVRTFLQQGDVAAAGMASWDGGLPSVLYNTDAQVSLLQHPQTLILIVLNLKTDGGYSDVNCELGEDEHWNFVNHNVTNLMVTVPVGFGELVDSFELRDGQLLPFQVPQASTEGQGGSLSLAPVQLDDDDLMTRVFFLANTEQVRQEVSKS